MNLVWLLALALAAVLAVGGTAAASDRRERRRRARAATDELLGQHHGDVVARAPRLLTALVAVAALAGAIGVGFAVADRSDQAAADRSDQAAANVGRCTTQVSTAWRRAIAVLLVGYTGEDDLEALELDAAELDLPSDPAAIRAEGRARLAAALADDARLDPDDPRPICPFVVGDPDRTPADPVDSATAELDAQTHPGD